jgi:translocator protein
MRDNILGLLVWLLICFAAAWIGSRFAPGEWYASLARPAWNPPNAVFAPVWSVLYAMMGVSAWLVWRERGVAEAAVPLALFLAQLGLNALWSYLFFGLHRPDWAMIEIVLLWLAILITLIAFWRIRPMAGALLIPYLCWVAFAAALNFELWRLNR